ncbi:MAG TPA: lysylphosphatidylglycerol synthase domain-containing protein [Flavisolibacter sp.]|nr:lysylphosphatidylglycerol synthase domain-containing protein [Flavisolibacter sp.]
MQPNKNIKIFINYFLGPLLFFWLSWSIYRQIVNQPRLGASWQQIQASFQSYKIFFLIGTFCLIPFNWGLEAKKWQVSMHGVYPVSFMKSLKAVLSGVSFSVTMPNRIGEYLGRMMYLPEGHRLKTISVTLVTSFAQLLITLVVGTIGLLLLSDLLMQHFPAFGMWQRFIIYGLIILNIFLFLLYFNVAAVDDFFSRWPRLQRFRYLVAGLHEFDGSLLGKLLLLSLLRYAVFVVQYVLLFLLFDVDVSIPSVMVVMTVVFLVLAIVPSIALVEVWLRGEVLILLMGLFSTNTLGIGFVAVTMWFMNLILPAIIGSLLILSIRAFKKRKRGDNFS